MKRTLQTKEAILAERKETLNLLGIAWSTRGSMTRENQLTPEQVKELVATVDRIQRKHFNTEYRLLYSGVDEMVRLNHTRALESADRNYKMYLDEKKRAEALKTAARELVRDYTPVHAPEGVEPMAMVPFDAWQRLVVLSSDSASTSDSSGGRET